MSITEIWDKHGFNIFLALCITFIIIFGLYNLFFKKEKGTYSKSYKYNVKSSRNYSPTSPESPSSGKSESKGERECRRVLHELFPNYSFPNSRPDFMKNEVTGSKLELDCYCNQLKLAVEYSGIQHYKFSPYFHSNKDQFKNQQYRDLIKRQLCKENGITLIEVPYTVKIEDIENFLRKELRQKGFQV